MTIRTEVQTFPREYNWIVEEGWGDFLRNEVCEFGHHKLQEVNLIWYERPNEDNLLNTLTEALEGAYDYD